ncbi:MAG: glycosyltransferase family 4 protein [Phycisphaerales bacterium]|nr:MAG: glycosyltransferase family 4 protein [Phycisphaerales bacterium]
MPEQTPSSRPRVIIVGPSPDLMGGIATVVGQMLRIDYADRYETELFPVTFAVGDRERTTSRITRHVRHVRRLRRRVRDAQAAIVHIHTCSGFSFYRSALDLLAVAGTGCKTVLHVHGAAFDEFWARSSRPARNLIRWVLNRADRVIALSRGWRDRLRMMAPRARVMVVENAVEAPPAVGTVRPSGPRRFVLLAKMDAWKGIDDLLDACALMASNDYPFQVTLAGPPGSAGDETILRKKTAQRGVEQIVQYVGPVQGQAKWELLQSSHVYLSPSHHEGMPISILEALACGLPVIATSVGAVPEVISHGREGLFAPPHSPQKLAQAMAAVARNEDLWRSMSQSARALAADRFSLQRFCDDLLSLYDELLSARLFVKREEQAKRMLTHSSGALSAPR